MTRGPVLLAWAAAFLLVSCSRDPLKRFERDPTTLAVAGRFLIARADLDSALAQSQAGPTDDPYVQSRVWDDLVQNVLVLNDLAPDPPKASSPQPLGPLANAKTLEEVVDRALQEKVYARVQVAPGEVEAYYRAHAEEFLRGPGVLLREMLLPGEPQARDAVKLLREKHSFLDVARLYSVSPQRGASQYFEWGELPDYVKSALDKARPGVPTAPVRLAGDGVQVFLLEGRFSSYAAPVESVSGEIRLRLADEKGAGLKADYVAGLRQRFPVVVFSSKLPFVYQKEAP